MDKRGDTFDMNNTKPLRGTDFGNLNRSELIKRVQAAQLDYAESLMREAFLIMSNPNATNADKLLAQAEIKEADQIRQSVKNGLSPQQQQALAKIISEEYDAFSRLNTGLHGILGPGSVINTRVATAEMQQAAQDSKALHDSILG